jgi:AraC family transcriptional regulator
MSTSLHHDAAITPALANLLAQAHHALDRSTEDARACLDQASQLLRRLHGEAEAARPCGGLAPWQVRRVKEHVEAHLDRSLPVAEMASLVRLSSSYFNRAFRVSFGCSPHGYVTQRRIALAMALMRGTTENLAQIAATCGCSDQAHLCRLFRGATGCTPREWRFRNAVA